MKDDKKIRILFVNNYGASQGAFDLCFANKQSLAHTWGADLFYKNKNCSLVFEDLRDSIDLEKSHNRLFNLYKIFLFQIRIFIKYCKYDVIYSAAGHCIDIFAFFKKVGIFKGEIFCVIHHKGVLPFAKSYKAIICFSKITSKYLIDRYGLNNVTYKYWGPYLPFYSTNLRDNKNLSKYDFYSNGKSFRDFQLLKRALLETGFSAIVLGFDCNNKNVKTITTANPIENIKYCSDCKVVVVPVLKEQKGVCGVTSINDALGIGIPVLVSDSCNLGFNVEEVGIGLEYEAGNIEDLKLKMRKILNPAYYQQLCVSVRKFAKENDYSHFSNTVKNLIFEKR